MLVLLDTYAPTYAVLVIALFECVAVAWVYGMYTGCFEKAAPLKLLGIFSLRLSRGRTNAI